MMIIFQYIHIYWVYPQKNPILHRYPSHHHIITIIIDQKTLPNEWFKCIENNVECDCDETKGGDGDIIVSISCYTLRALAKKV